MSFEKVETSRVSILKSEIGSKVRFIRISVKKRNDVSKKGLFFIHFQRNDPQYRRYPGQRITADHVASLLIFKAFYSRRLTQG